ncbi:hypothetical protein JOB18_025298 [Solea senegalensis]|uniref:Uncharacterized protein n=1 Tax=Solea senegalensis TaxID=28829 RepID=A0AAV6PGT7_SOLSE|nr:hypothetical protein JOB18_025298 [Solea senegalensis]
MRTLPLCLQSCRREDVRGSFSMTNSTQTHIHEFSELRRPFTALKYRSYCGYLIIIHRIIDNKAHKSQTLHYSAVTTYDVSYDDMYNV